MKNVFISLFLMVAFAAQARQYYLSPTGNDSNNGSSNSPFKTLNKVWTVVNAGDTVYLKGGTYQWNSAQYLSGKNGTANNLIKIWNYPGELPILTNASSYSGNDLIEWTGNYIHWKGLEIANFKGNTSFSAFRSENCNNCIFENINYHHNPMGFTIRNCNNNLVLNCDFHHNRDNAGDNADGINITYITNTSYTNTVRGCRAWNNSDDGFDFWANNSAVTLENSWAFYNGYADGKNNPIGDGSGIKLGEGTGTRNINRCFSVHNSRWGLNENNESGISNIYNNTFAYNGVVNLILGYWPNNSRGNLKNNISHSPASNGDYLVLSKYTNTNNTWNSLVATNADFVSTDETQLLRARKSDGSLPDITFMNLVSTSKLINAGVNVGLPYSGSAPDVGAIETGVSTPPPIPVNVPPVVNAGQDVTITLPLNSVVLNGSATDPDGTILSYQWKSGNTILGTSQSLTVSGLTAGTYTYQFSATDNNGATTSDNVTVTVNAQPPIPPTPVYDTVYCDSIRYATPTSNGLTRKKVTYVVKKGDKWQDNTGTVLDLFFYYTRKEWFFMGRLYD